MRVLQVVTLIDPENSYGGPVRVAVNQAQALRAAGHVVEVVAGARGFASSPPALFDGCTVRLFPVKVISKRFGFSGLIAPSMINWLRRSLSSFDVVHIHLARDLITMPAAALALAMKIPSIFQTHGMIRHSARPAAVALDSLITRRLLRRAESVLALTNIERRDLVEVCSDLNNIQLVPNGIPVPPEDALRHVKGDTTDSDAVEVLFLARLHERKRPMLFAQAARALASSYPNARFKMVGPDEGEGPKIEAFITNARGLALDWEGAVSPDQTTERLARADIYVLPSINEPFPMSVLEAMALGIPSVVTSSCGLAPVLERSGSGLVCDESLDSLVDGIGSLLESSTYRSEMGQKASGIAKEEFSMTATANDLVRIYLEARLSRNVTRL